jgi:hypothetical protein
MALALGLNSRGGCSYTSKGRNSRGGCSYASKGNIKPKVLRLRSGRMGECLSPYR